VTIDLNGFSIISTTAPGSDSPAGIRIDGSLSPISNVTVCNGRITGFDRAVRVQNSFSNIIVDNIHSANCRRAGIEANTISGTGVKTLPFDDASWMELTAPEKGPMFHATA
jgi:hypothetical protein